MDAFWAQANEANLRQGDWIANCLVPVFGPQFAADGSPQALEAETFDLIIVTQSCDLEQRKARLVAGVPIFALAQFEAANPPVCPKRALERSPEGPSRRTSPPGIAHHACG